MSLQQFCQQSVITVSPAMNLVEACHVLEDRNTSCLVVEAEGKLCGIVTDRDIALRATGQCKDPQQTTVQEIMTPNPACIGVNQTLHDLTSLMHQYRVRRAPVVDERNKV